MLDDLWAVLEPVLPPDLIPESQHKSLAKLCTFLPIEGQLGFECRLSEHCQQVDLSQVFTNDRTNLTQKYGCENPGHPFPGPWLDLLQAWASLEPTHRTMIKNLWFEYDHDRPPPETIRNPAFFIEPHQGLMSQDHEAWLETLGDLIASLPGQANESLTNISSLLLNAIPGDFKLGICGFMVSRTPHTLRALLAAPSVERLADFLHHCGMGSIPAGLERAHSVAEQCGMKPVFSLDFSEELLGRVGLELSWPDKGKTKPPVAFMNWLQTEGLCSVEKRLAAEQFPILITPDQAGVEWPAPLIVESILGPANGLSCIAGQVHHFKLVFQEGRLPEAKVYFGFSHVFSEPDRQKI